MCACTIEEISGDLFAAPGTHSMAHCVAADLRMGKGIAVKFRNKFGQVAKLQQQKVAPGGVALLQDQTRYIYYLVTKKSSWDKPTYQQLHSSLSAMRSHMLKHSIDQLAMPRIGCGLDGLVWPKVKELLLDVFKEDSIKIVVYNYAPPKGGIPFVSSDRELRIAAISAELSTGQYDIVSLQEVWSQVDCQTLREKTEAVLPYSHYFYSGVIGAGLLVLSKYPIIGTLFHAWSVNGYFHRIQHADWFGGKGVGLCRIRVGERIVHLYNAHLHAEYDNENDEYKTHRVIQAFDTAQFIEATRGDSVLQILAGDLNTKPQDISYNVLLYTSKMRDSCAADVLVSTNECQQNSYTKKQTLEKNPHGIRIDHIFVRSADHIKANIVEYLLPFPERVPAQKFSFSDHEAVLVRLRLSELSYHTEKEELAAAANVVNTCPVDVAAASGDGDDLKQHCSNGKTLLPPPTSAVSRIAVLHEAVALCDSSLQKLKVDRILYYSFAIFLAFLLVALVEYAVPNGFKTLYLLLKFVLFGVILFCAFMGSIWNFMERNGILSGKMSMEIMLRNAEKYELGLD